MKVFVVYEIYYDTQDNHGVFTTREKAEEYLEHMVPRLGSTPYKNIEEFEVDELVDWVK